MTHITLPAAYDSSVKIAFKLHTEGVILGELMTHLVNNAGAKAIHWREWGGTQVLWR
jgi:osmoprotectant transport system permease protein